VLIIVMIARGSLSINGLQVGSVGADPSSLKSSVFALQDPNRRAGID
jgi:hypothetical protein